MKTTLILRSFLLTLVAFIYFLGGYSAHAQTYATISNGLWSAASTWQGGSIPNATNIPASAVVNIKHIVTYTGGNIVNNGTVNINNNQGTSPKLNVPLGVIVTNNATGKINIINAEYRQYRFVGGLEVGVAQTGSFVNNGGYVQITNSFVEVAQDWTNQGTGVVAFHNSSLEIGRTYSLKNSGIDTIESSSISVGMHGAGDFSLDGSKVYFFKARFEVASTN